VKVDELDRSRARNCEVTPQVKVLTQAAVLLLVEVQLASSLADKEYTEVGKSKNRKEKKRKDKQEKLREKKMEH